MNEIQKCQKKIEKCDKLIKSGKTSARLGSNFCDVVGDSVGLFLSPLTLFMAAFDCADSAKETNSKLAKAVYYTGAGVTGVLGAVVVAPSALILGSAFLTVAGVETARGHRNKKRLNKLIEKKQSLESQMKEMETEFN